LNRIEVQKNDIYFEQYYASLLHPNLATGKSQDSTLNRNEVQKYDIFSGEPSILKRNMLPFFTKTLVQMA
jgi:hypothetical protein